jgi:hypothetical protein
MEVICKLPDATKLRETDAKLSTSSQLPSSRAFACDERDGQTDRQADNCIQANTSRHLLDQLLAYLSSETGCAL